MPAASRHPLGGTELPVVARWRSRRLGPVSSQQGAAPRRVASCAPSQSPARARQPHRPAGGERLSPPPMSLQALLVHVADTCRRHALPVVAAGVLAVVLAL